MKKFTLFYFLLILLLGCQTPKNEFIKVVDNQFQENGDPYYYFGINFWHGAYLGADLVEGDKERLVRELDTLKANHITNLRIMAATEESPLIASVSPAFQTSPGEYNEELLQGLDFMLAEMAKRDMKAIMVLNNYWQWSGGMSQYVHWIHGHDLVDPDVSGDWHGFQKQSAKFYGDSACNALFRDYIEMLITRTNTVTKVHYSEDPAIMSWQLANEPRPDPNVQDSIKLRNEFKQWIHETAKFIRSLDTNHLISTGNEGVEGSRGSKSIFMDSHSSTYIDYLTFHIWPKNWGWFDAKRPDETFERTLQNTDNYFAEHIEIANNMNMPIVLEEFGMERDTGSFSPESSTHYRDTYLEHLFEDIVESIHAGSSMAGLNYWTWGGEARASHDDYRWRVGDSFMGDPPQEPQGLNAIFTSDKSTLALFRKYHEMIYAE